MNRAEDVFERISKGIYYNKNLKIYTNKYLKDILTELEEQEDFERCVALKQFIKRRFRHNKNYKTPLYSVVFILF